jgi:ABC transporter DrrB family efflux protein
MHVKTRAEVIDTAGRGVIPVGGDRGDAAMIEVEQVAKSFGAIRALDGVDLVVPAGSVEGLLGPNGAGKTTLVRVLATLLAPDAGRVRIAGVDLADDPATVRTLVGLAGQYAAVDESLTGLENLLMVGRLYRLRPNEARVRADEALERLGLVHAADRPVRTYSGGMRRRLDLGASLVGRPRVLLVDEPTTGLDPRARAEVWDFIGDLVADGTTVLLTTQYLEEADHLADHIVVIDRGRLIAGGSPRELKHRAGSDLLQLEVRADDVDRVVGLLAGIGRHSGQRAVRGNRICIPVWEPVADLMAAVRILDRAEIVPLDISVREPSLDDVFLALTGPEADASELPSTLTTVPPAAPTALDPVPRARLPLSAVASDALVLTRRNLLHILRTPELLVFATVQPIVFLLLFRYVFGGAIRVPGGNYVDYLIPGIIVQTVVFGAPSTSVGLAEDMSRGIIDRFRSLPMARSAVLAGRILADLLRNAFLVVLMVAVGVLVGFRLHTGVPAALAAVVVTLLLGYALSWLFALVGLSVANPEAAQLAGLLPIFPLVFASSVFTPVDTMPGWLQAFAEVQPITRAADAVRGLTQGGPVATDLVWTAVWVVALLAVFAPLAVRRYSRR